MANLGKKGDSFLARFRYQGKEYKKSLRTGRRADAQAAMHGVERALHGLATGLVQVPDGVDPGDFILSGGTLRTPARPRRRVPPLSAVIDEYLAGQRHKAASSVYTERVHLRNLVRKLGASAQAPADRIAHRDLEQFLQARLGERTPSTVHKERDTITSLFKWAVAQGYVEESPAAGLTPIKEESDLPCFRTTSEIEEHLGRGGLSEAEVNGAWDCLYLTTSEIADILDLVRDRSDADFGPLLHAIPAYTGMRRGEVLRLRWSNVDLDRGHVVARSRKQSRRSAETARRIDLHPELEQVLRVWRGRRPGGQFVIGQPGGEWALDVDRANRALWQPMRGTSWCLSGKRNWFKIGFHTYRHSFASNLAARGVDQRIVDEWMGHQTEAMRKRYRHLFPKERRSAMASFSFAQSAPREETRRHSASSDDHDGGHDGP